MKHDPVRRAAGLLVLLAVAGCGAEKGAATRTPDVAVTVASSIADGAELAGLVGWKATVSLHGVVQVRRVEFLIDDKVRWTQKKPAPYRFSHDGLLAPWVLGPGEHELVVRVVPNPGSPVDAVSHVTVAERPAGSARLAGTYARRVDDGDARGTADYRTARNGAFGTPPAVGRWVLHVTGDGALELVAPDGSTAGEPYSVTDPKARQTGTMHLFGPAAWLQPNGGDVVAFCRPEQGGSYTWTKIGATLEILATDRVCADRDTVLVGHWTEVT